MQIIDKVKCPNCNYENEVRLESISHIEYLKCSKCEVELEIHYSHVLNKIVYVSCAGDNGSIIK